MRVLFDIHRSIVGGQHWVLHRLPTSCVQVGVAAASRFAVPVTSEGTLT